MARKKKPTTPLSAAKVCDLGTAELAKQTQLVKERVDQYTVRARNVNNVWPLDRYLSRDTITSEQYRAGRKLYRDFLRGNIQSHYGSTWFDPSKSFDSIYQELAPTEAQCEALMSFRSAYRSLNHQGAHIVWFVVCNEMDMSMYEKVMNWRVGYGMIRLREALDDLRIWYGTKNEPTSC